MNTESFEAFKAHWLAQGFDEVLERDWAPHTVLETHSHPFGVQAVVTRFIPDAGPGVMSQWLDRINPESIHVTVLIIAVYAGMRLLEGWGLWRARAWASWLGCIGSAAYLPLDVYALYHHPGWHTWALLIVNLVIVWVLWRDIRRRKRI